MFIKKKIPTILPLTLEYQIEKIKKIEDKEEVVKAVYRLLTDRFYGGKFKTFFKIHQLFQTSIDSIWKRPGFLHCTNFNHLFRTILILTGKFKESDIKYKYSFLYYLSLHQYVEVKIGNEYVNIDLWAYSFNIEYGDYARGFHA